MPAWEMAGSGGLPLAFSTQWQRCSCPRWATLRYEYGIFKQSIKNGWQFEEPDNWLRDQDPWEVTRPNERVEVKLNCSFEVQGGTLRAVTGKPSTIIGLPFERPVVGYGGKTINTLRL